MAAKKEASPQGTASTSPSSSTATAPAVNGSASPANHSGGDSASRSGGGSTPNHGQEAASSPAPEDGVASSGPRAASVSAATAGNSGHDRVLAAEYFAAGSTVRCVTCHGKSVEGVVAAFDPASRMLILKTAATNKRPSLNDLHFVNVALVSEVSVVSEAANGESALAAADPPSLNVTRLTSRLQTNVERRKLNVKAFKAGVSPDGQRLFQVISKTIDQVDWQGDNICVMGKVLIAPPYKPENIKGASDSKAVVHLRKIIEKHLEDQRRLAVTASGEPTPSASPAPTATSGGGQTSSSSSSAATAAATAGSLPAASGSNNGPANGGGPRRGPQQQESGRGGGGGGGGGRQRGSPAPKGGGVSSPKPSYFMHLNRRF